MLYFDPIQIAQDALSRGWCHMPAPKPPSVQANIAALIARNKAGKGKRRSKRNGSKYPELNMVARHDYNRLYHRMIHRENMAKGLTCKGSPRERPPYKRRPELEGLSGNAYHAAYMRLFVDRRNRERKARLKEAA